MDRCRDGEPRGRESHSAHLVVPAATSADDVAHPMELLTTASDRSAWWTHAASVTAVLSMSAIDLRPSSEPAQYPVIYIATITSSHSARFIRSVVLASG